MNESDFLIDGPTDAGRTIVLAHGAGAGMDAAFMTVIAQGLAGRGQRVVRFEFPYMQRRRATGTKSPPDRAAVLIETWHAVVEQFGSEGLVIGGKSMGGRIASVVADEAGVAGLVCLGYPFHPVGKPEKTRVDHLERLQTPTLILQGARDSFGTPEEVAGYALSDAIRFEWLADGDHSFKPRKKSGRTLEENLARAVACFADFVEAM